MLMHNPLYVNLASKFLMTLASQYLNFKCAENEFKNPFMNGLQMMVMSAAAQDVFKFTGHSLANTGSYKSFDLGSFILQPMLFGFSTVIDDLLMSRGWTSKHYFTDLTSVYSVSETLNSNGSGIDGLCYDFLRYKGDKKTSLYSVSETLNSNGSGIDGLFSELIKQEQSNFTKGNSHYISGGLLVIKYLQEYFTGSKGYIETTRSLQMKVTQSTKDLEYVTGGAVNMKAAVASQAVMSETLNLLPNFVEDRSIKLMIPQFIPLLKLFSNLGISMIFSSAARNSINLRNNQITTSPEKLLKIASVDKHSSTLHEIDRITDDINLFSQNILMINGGLIDASSLSKAFPALNLRSTLGELLNSINTIETQKEIDEIAAQISKSKSSLVSNPRTVIERNGLEYYLDHSQKQQEKLDLLQKVLEDNTKYKNAFQLLSGVDSIIPGLINMELQIPMNMCNLSSFLSQLPQIEKAVPSLQRLVDLYKFLETAKNSSYVSYKSHDGNYLKMKDIRIDINGANKLIMDELTLEAGKWYLLTGKSGCGKTTLMSALRGLPNFTPEIDIRGDVYYPKSSPSEGPKIYMLTQTNNFPYAVSLLESICYPMVTTEAERKSYKTLIEELMLKMEGFDRNSSEGSEYLTYGLLSRLDERINDVTSETSGGQQKKMSIAGLIVRVMKETGMLKIYNEAISLGASHDNAMAKAKYSVGPVLVLIDETFNGLDSGANGGTFEYSSKGLVLKTLKDSLPASAIVVSVEHQPQIDQYNGRIHLNGDGSYNCSGEKAIKAVPEQTEDFEPLQGMLSVTL